MQSSQSAATNLFGHPAPSTVEALVRFGAEVYRTDQGAAVSITTNGRHQTVRALGRTSAKEGTLLPAGRLPHLVP